MKRVRLAVFWCHLVVGAVVGLVVLVMSVTGVLLTYQRQMTAWADARALDARPRPASGARLPLDSLLARVRVTEPGVPTAVTWRSAPDDAPVEVAFGRERTLFVDGATGTVLGEGSTRARAFFRTVTDWHRWLGARGETRSTGKAITGAANLGFLFLVTSGFYLWWPRSWTPSAIRNVAIFRRGLRGKARDFNWHHVIGLWSAVPLFLVVLSGVVISYPWATALAYRAAGDRPPPAARPRPTGGDGARVPLGNIDEHRARAEQRFPGWRSITLQLTGNGSPGVTFALDGGTGGQPQERAQLTLDGATGRELRWEPFATGTPGRRLRSILRFTHTGEVLGPAGQTVAGLVSLGAVVLVWTGLALSWRRLAAWRGRRRTRDAARPRGAVRSRTERAA